MTNVAKAARGDRTRLGAVAVAMCALVAVIVGHTSRAGATRYQAEELTMQPEAKAAAGFVPHPAPPTVVVVNALVTDNGDGDGWADTNETVELRLTLRNRMGFDLTGLKAQLSTDDPKIACITKAVLSIGDLAAGEMRVTSDVFRFRVADVSRVAVGEDFSAVFAIAMNATEFAALPEPQVVVLDLDLDVSAGAGPTTFFEGFEAGLGAFAPMHLDAALNPPDGDLENDAAGVQNADGYRCQYNDPDWEGSNTSPGSPHAEVCYPGFRAPDAFWWTVTDNRSFSGEQALYWGQFLNESLGFTTPIAQLEAVVTSATIPLGWGKVCSSARNVVCEDELDCPIGESCDTVTPLLSMKQQISQMDHRLVTGGPDGIRGADRAVVQVQLADDPAGVWTTIDAFVNPYDTQPNDVVFNCAFDPVDDGNTEEDFFDPTDPERRLGPSSTCYPRRTFVHQGDTDEPFDPVNIGDAADGPGLEGAAGPGTWVETRFSLQRYLGRRIRVRLLETGVKFNATTVNWQDAFARNPDPRDDGWFVDDVTVSDALAVAATVAVDMNPNTDLVECDCAPDDEDLWAIPGEPTGLNLDHAGGLSGATILTWSEPEQPGGSVARYEVLRATAVGDLEGSGSCVTATEETWAEDVLNPFEGTVHFFLVRATNTCGAGSLGTDSAGVPRAGPTCPVP